MTGQDVISVEELNELLSRYAIGKKPLAALLGWGATTVLRYGSGLCPAGEYGAHLKKLYQEPLFYLEVLEENKDRLCRSHSHSPNFPSANAISQALPQASIT